MTRAPISSTASNITRVAAAINDSTIGLTKGAKVWYKTDDQTWAPAELKSSPDETCTIQVEDGRLICVDRELVLPANPKLQDGIQDLTHLTYLNEPSILGDLQYRYAKDEIYTFAGPVLIAVNPCKRLPLYTPEIAVKYKGGARDSVNNLEPHIYLVAANAFRAMVREQQSQSLIVNGESGAGKTETTKKAMQYFATLAGGTGVEDQVLETNPILEAFGNAKTLRNHNSSRFGKLIEIHFNKTHHICGACIRTYLLEKSRVVHQLKGERSYHVFYQLVRGATNDERKAWRLPTGVKNYKYLAQSGCTDIEGVDDGQDFREVQTALADVGIDKAQQRSLFSLLSGVLWMGNVEFDVDPADDSVSIKPSEAVSNVCHLLGVEEAALGQAITRKKIKAPDGIIVKLLNVDECRDARDTLAKALYAAIFNWIVEQINAKLAMNRSVAGHAISILDIYGFEQFVKNSFEQLCINYANERLQQQFTRHLFTLEQEEYEKEGIDWTKVEFIDNQDCVDVIEAMPPKGLGVLAVLDSQCRFPKATDETFLCELKDKLSHHSHFSTNARNPGEFAVLHYAGQVAYDSNGFLDKNKDTLNTDLTELLANSSVPLVQTLAAGITEDVESRRGGQTVGARFNQQLRELVAQLDTTGLHFVRCIKPNAALERDKFEASMILHQLRCCGVLEVARIARAGFPTRYAHAAFAERYRILLPGLEQQHELEAEGALQACLRLVAAFKLDASQYQVGASKIFFRPGVLGYVEDLWARMQAGSLTIQTHFRMWRARKQFTQQRDAAVVLQALFRARQARVGYAALVARHRAALVVQHHWRGHSTRSSYKVMLGAAVMVQRAFRKWRFNCKVKVRRHEREKRELQEMLDQESFATLRKQFGMTIEEVRLACTAWQEGKSAAAAAAYVQSRTPVVAGAAVAATAVAATAAVAVGAEVADNTGAAAGSAEEAAPVAAAPPAGAAQATPAVYAVAAATSAVVAATAAAELAASTPTSRAMEAPTMFQGEVLQAVEEGSDDEAAEQEQEMPVAQTMEVDESSRLQPLRPVPDGDLPPPPAPAAAAGAPDSEAADGVVESASAQDDEVLAAVAATAAVGGVAAAAAGVAVAAADRSRAVPDPVVLPSAADLVTSSSLSAAAAAQVQHMAMEASPVAKGVRAARMSAGGMVAGTAVAAAAAAPRAESKADSQAVERLQVENVKLTRQLQLEKNLRERYAAKLEAQTADWLEQVRVLQEYIQTVRLSVGDANLPQLPSSVPGAATPVGPAAAPATPTADGARSLPITPQQLPNGSAASPGSSTSREIDVAAGPVLPPVRTSTPDHPSPADHSRANGNPIAMGPAAAMVGTGMAAAAAGGPSTSGAAGTPSKVATNPTQKYVNHLNSEMSRVGQVLEDDVNFIREVREGRSVAEEMDPSYELNKLKKKFEIWKREFKDKLRTTEEVLRKMDKVEKRGAVGGAASSASMARNGIGSMGAASVSGVNRPGSVQGSTTTTGRTKKGFMHVLFK